MEFSADLLRTEIERIRIALKDICNCISIKEAKKEITIALNAIMNMDESKTQRNIKFEIENMPYDELNKKIFQYKYGTEEYDYFILSNPILLEVQNKVSLDELVAIFVHEIKHILYYKHKEIADTLMLENQNGNLPSIEDLRGNNKVYLKAGQIILNIYKDKLDNCPDYNFYEVEHYDTKKRFSTPFTKFFQEEEMKFSHEPLIYTYNRGVQKLAEIIYADLYDEETYWEKVKLSILHTLQEFKLNILSKFDTNDKIAKEIEMQLTKTSITSYQNFLRDGLQMVYSNRWAGVSFVHQTIANNKVSNLQENTLFKEPKVIITEGFKEKIFQKEDVKYIKFELSNILDNIAVDIENIESKADKYVLLDEIHKYNRLCNEKKEEYVNKLETKLSYNDEKKYKELVTILSEYIAKLAEYREIVLKSKIQPKRYGIFIENPKGYEG